MQKFYTNVRQWGNDILYIGYENGKRIQERREFRPRLYINSDVTPTERTCYDGTPLRSVDFNDIKDAKQFIKDNKFSQTIYGIDKFNYEYITREFRGDIEYDLNAMRIQYLDIEVYSGNGFPDPFEAIEEVTCLTLKDVLHDEFHVWVCTKWGDFDDKNLQHIDKAEADKLNIVMHVFGNEKEMLRDFILWYSLNPPDILSGWYSRDFDIPYVYNRLKRILGSTFAKKLSPWGIVREKTSMNKRFGQNVEQKSYEIYGVSEIDYLDLYKKYTYTTSESFALDFIANKELGVGKIQYEGSLTELLTTDYQKYVEYNIIDVARIHDIDRKIRFLEQLLEVSYAGKVATFQDSLGTVKFWEVLIYNHLYDKDQLPELKGQSAMKEEYPGGYVKEPIPGLYKWVMSFDLTSLYPKIKQQVNIGVESHIPDHKLPQELLNLRTLTPDDFVYGNPDTSALKKYNVSMSGNCQFYTRDKPSFLAELMEKFFNKRKVYKVEMLNRDAAGDKEGKSLYKSKQLAMKILINAAYGACGNNFFQYYSLENASAVTTTGQIVIRFIERHINEYLQNLMGDDKDRIIAIDTDSVYVNFEDIVNRILPDEEDNVVITKFLDKVSTEKIEPFIKKKYHELYQMMNHFEEHMNMDREVIADKAVWTAKKRYAMNVYDIEGVTHYDDPELKIMGIEVVSSRTPSICRDALKESIRIMMREDEDALIKHVSDFKKKFFASDATQIASNMSVNKIEEDSSTQNTKASVLYNKLRSEHGLEDHVEEIKPGSKIKLMYLKTPNIVRQNAIAFTTRLPKEFGLDQYIDYQLQFEKTFEAPLKRVSDLVGWKIERINTLM